MMLRIGLTGGIASGKSTVAHLLAELSCFVIDADKVVAELYQMGSPGHDAIREKYGEGVLDEEGEIDRMKLSAVALSTPEAANELNTLIHPLVIAETQRRLLEKEQAVSPDALIGVVEATLIIEGGTKHLYDKIVVVDTDPVSQIDRAIQRGLKREEAERRMARQSEREVRLRNADYVIRNDGDRLDTADQVRQLHAKLLLDLERKSRGETPFPEVKT